MDIEAEVLRTIREYRLIEGDEKVAVALSGGKDSTSVLYILNKLGYNVCGLMIDLYLGEWSRIHRENMERFCRELGVPLTIIDLKEELGQGICFIKAVLRKKKNLTGCTVCGIIKRWLLNRGAKRIGADKLATGHNLDDEAQNVLMNFLKGNIFLGVNSAPATGGKKVEGFVQRIKPLFFVPESEVLKYAKRKKFKILYDKCPCAFGTYRVDTREWMRGIGYDKKRQIVENFQKIALPLRRRAFEGVSFCKNCGEPSRGELCNACKIFVEI
ncbi:adenine nucleotide alpha hydrolase family protein [Candidatus Pacearchaeota archaeon]|nr:MAG: adenine nucleotide alpha hydrolase family protein [Candidatus Pacearchaeota archaeon]